LGLRINLGKSRLVPIEEVEDVKDLAHILGCRVASLPMKYLGLPLSALYKSIAFWNGVIEKIERRLADWKTLYLLNGGQLTMLKSTLSHLPTYYLSLFSITVVGLIHLRDFKWIFLWGSIGDEVKFHLANWMRICTPIKSGGLRV